MTLKEDLYTIDLSDARWYKSPFSSGGEQCVEVADLPGGAVAVRDSKNPEKEALRFTAAEWDALRQGFRAGLL